MVRLLSALLAVVLIASPGSAADPGKLTIRWHGQSFFDLETSKGTRVVFDPHIMEAYGRFVLPKADVVLISHEHNDHNQASEAVSDLRKAKVLHGLERPEGKRFDWASIDEKIADVRVRSVGTWHDDVQGMEHGKNAAFVVEADGMRIVHLGDLGHQLTEDQVRKLKKGGDIDVLMIPVGGIYTLNGADALKVVEQLKPTRYVLPMHYGTKVFDQVLTVDEFRDGWDKEFVRHSEATGTLVVEPGFKTKQPVLVLLGWKEAPAPKEKEKP